MAINAEIARGYAWRMIIIGAACLLLGAWGVYDYAVDIPRRQRLHEHAALLELCQDALETEQAAGSLTPEAETAVDAITAEMQRIYNRELAESLEPGQAAPTQQQMEEVMTRLRPENESNDDVMWMRFLGGIGQALMGERRLPLTELDYPAAHGAFQATRSALDDIGQITAPGKYDRATQWAFIACLPCAPYFLWVYLSARRRKYTLDDDGTLHTPAGAWKADEIADIDMSRWMAKSIAWAVHNEGDRVKLDDYRFTGLHRIVGGIASRLYPDKWDQDARPPDRAESPPEAPSDHEAADPGDEDGGFSESAAEADAR